MVWLLTLTSVLIISLVSLIGAFVLSIKKEKLEHFLLYFVSFAVGALLGDVFIHIIPEVSKSQGFTLKIGLGFLFGVLVFFIIERFIQWHHCHKVEHGHNVKIKPLAYINLVGDGFHNFLDGIIIAAAFLINVPVGVATTLAVLFHEIPQEISEFGVLLYAGFSRKKALLLNFFSALSAVVGAIITLFLAGSVAGLETMMLAIAGGGFIYIAGSDLIPELHKDNCSQCKVYYQFLAMLLGIGVMLVLLIVEI